MDSVHLFDTVVLILHRMNVDVEKYIEVSLSEGLNVKLYVKDEIYRKVENEVYGNGMEWFCERMQCDNGADGLLVITDDDLTAQKLEKMDVAVVGYRAPGYEYMGFSTSYVVEELPMVEDEYFNLVYMRARHIPVVIARTKRTIIREMTQDDLPVMYELYSDSVVKKWCEPLYEYDEELEFTKAYIENMYGFYGYGLWLVFDRKNGELIGRAGLSNRQIDGCECCELGYIIKGTRQRQGLGYEVSTAIMEYAGKKLGMEQLWLCIETDNTASIALAKKLEFEMFGSSTCDDKDGNEKMCYIYRKNL